MRNTRIDAIRFCSTKLFQTCKPTRQRKGFGHCLDKASNVFVSIAIICPQYLAKVFPVAQRTWIHTTIPPVFRYVQSERKLL